MKVFIIRLVIIMLVIPFFYSCEKDSLESSNSQEQTEYRITDTTLISFDDTLVSIYEVGNIHNYILYSSQIQLASLDEYNYSQISNILNSKFNSLPLSMSLDFDISDKLSLDSFVLNESFVKNSNSNIHSYQNYLDSLNAKGIINEEESIFLNDFRTDITGNSYTVEEVDSIYLLKFKNLNFTNSFSRTLVGISFSIGVSSHNYWNQFNKNFQNLTTLNDNEIHALVGRDLVGAWIGSLWFAYDHRDCLDWGCDRDAGKRLGKYAARGAVSASVGSWVSKKLGL